MKKYLLLTAAATLIALLAFYRISPGDDPRVISYTADPRVTEIALFWKDDKGNPLGSLGRLKNFVESRHRRLRLAMNGGMFTPDQEPLGLYIEKGAGITPLDTASGAGNFYLKPNGVFYVKKDGTAAVSATEQFRRDTSVWYATQSGPMLVVDGALHPAFREGSENLNIRNGVGVLPDGQVLFAISREKINLYDFARFFIKKGCRNALYLDGFVSRAYIPGENWVQTDGQFGVMIGVLAR